MKLVLKQLVIIVSIIMFSVMSCKQNNDKSNTSKIKGIEGVYSLSYYHGWYPEHQIIKKAYQLTKTNDSMYILKKIVDDGTYDYGEKVALKKLKDSDSLIDTNIYEYGHKHPNMFMFKNDTLFKYTRYFGVEPIPNYEKYMFGYLIKE